MKETTRKREKQKNRVREADSEREVKNSFCVEAFSEFVVTGIEFFTPK